MNTTLNADIEILRNTVAEIRMAAVTTPDASIAQRVEALEGIRRLAATAMGATDGDTDDSAAWHLWHRIEDIDGTAKAGIRLGWNAALNTAISLAARKAERALQ